ncbi:CoA ester lyase [Microbacterium foliorum]|uniref:Citrate lyase subunit beta-like protein n=1 Tax=Microbacterium foliorum TaxID=104336 RepID=A0A0F0KA39_9MICO|nr:CoA ester lyase [Microbacterium foliorum]AXL12086.1 CoA ester lyase [Microbacterium foliorum]KJL17743.1 Citrate lyase subunit beta-like protein [Microbacterium foliorum]
MTFALGPALLFCPADRPERFRGALDKADAVILDLEDAVLPAAKAGARGNLIDADIDPDRVVVRVNAPGTEAFVSDLATLSQTDFRTVMVAKTESPESLAPFDPRFSLIALCETARGVHAAHRIAAHPQVVAMMWGAEDLVASLGGTSSRRPDGGYRDVARYARSRVLLESGAQGKAAIDAVHVDIDDTAGLESEANDAAASGFTATACIHPSQVAIIRAAYRPDDATLAWARAVLDAAAVERGVFRFEGRMIDEPVLRHARSVVSRAG